MDLADTVVLRTTTAFLNHGVSESVDKVGEVETAGGTVGSCTNSRHLAEAMMTAEVWGTRPSYLTQGTELGQEGDSVISASGRKVLVATALATTDCQEAERCVT